MRIPAAATLLAAAATAALGCHPTRAQPRAEDDGRVPVRVATVERGPVSRPVRAAGTVAAKDTRDLSFKVGGLVAEVRVREGAEVRRGQVLAALDPTELAAGVRQAREGLPKARRDRDRARLLRAGGAIALAQAEDAETGAAVAEAALAAAEFNLRHTVLSAPDDGWVDLRQVEPGEVVAPGKTVLRVSGRSRGFVVRAALPERDALGLEPGDPAQIRLDARPEEALAGRVTEMARAAARGTNTFQVELRLDRPPRGLLSGLGAKVEIARQVPAEGTVPLAALQDGDGARGAVYVIDGQRAHRIPVRVAFLQGDRAVLAGGLEGVERVVAEGAAQLADGAAVKLVP